MNTIFDSINESNYFQIIWGGYTLIAVYYEAVMNTRVTSRRIADFLQTAHDQYGMAYEDAHLIGHSLGAHVAGFAGKNIKNMGNELGRISGTCKNEV